MKKLFSLLLVFIFMLLLISCSLANRNGIYTRKDPYIVTNATAKHDSEYLHKLENTNILNDTLSMLNFDDFSERYKESNAAVGIVIVYVENTQTVYWDNTKGDRGGYGIATVSVISVLEENDTAKQSEFFCNSQKFNLWEPYTISPDGSIVYPTYSTREYGGSIGKTENPIMKQGEYYILKFTNNTWANKMIDCNHLCYLKAYHLTQSELKTGNGTIINDPNCPLYQKYKDASYSPASRIYEFSEEAYERSKAIVEQYESEGKTREDGSYYLYHAMVVDAWEKYGAEISIEA